MAKRRHANVVNIDELEFEEQSQGRFALRGVMLASQAGGEQVGANLFEIPPGKVAFPHHYHCGIEEAIYVLSGSGTTRIGDERVEIRAGDWISYPAGPEHAHQMINTGDAPLRYLCVSSQSRADVVGYPDSGKYLAAASPSSNFSDPPWVRVVFRDDDLDYYDGEDAE